MKPSKSMVMCPDCGRQKMLFETERKANDFIKWNGDDLYVPEGCELRAYYCPSCCGWHISHHSHHKSYDRRTENLIGAFNRTKKSQGRLDKLIHYDSYQMEVMNTEAKAREIFDAIPDELKATKKQLRNVLTKYYAANGIEDKSGHIRGAVYKLWSHYIYQKHNGI